MGKVKVLKNGQYIDIQPQVLKDGQWDKATGYAMINGQWVKITEERQEEYFPCIWSSSYNESGSMRTDNKHIYQGDYHGVNPSSTRGNLCGLLGFNYNEIRTRLQGCSIESIQLEINNMHWYWSSGGTINIGTHNKATKPSSYKPSLDSEKKIGIKQQSFKRYEKKLVDLPLTVAQDFINGNAKGLILWINSSNMLYYGYFAGCGELYPPVLKVTYYR